MVLISLVSSRRYGCELNLSLENVASEEKVRLGCVISSLSKEALNLLSGDIVVSLDTEINIVVGDIC